MCEWLPQPPPKDPELENHKEMDGCKDKPMDKNHPYLV